MNSTFSPSLFDRLARITLLALFFLMPVFAVPSLSVPFGFSKTALFIICTAIAAGLWSFARIRDGEIVFPKGTTLLFLGMLVFTGAISTIASGALRLSWSGAWFDPTSFSFFLALAVFLFLCAMLLRSADHIFYVLVLFLSSAALVAFFHLLRAIAGPDLLAFSFFTEPVSTLLVRWNDIGVFFGAVSVLLLVTLEFMKLRAGLRIAFGVALFASLVLLAITHLALVWLLLGAFALVFLVYLVSFKHLERAAYEEVRYSGADIEGRVEPKPTEIATPAVTDVSDNQATSTQGRRIPALSLGVFLCALIFIAFSGPLGGRIAARLNIVSVEARPSFSATLEVARQTIKENPFFGAGPNLFAREWLRYKPEGSNQTIFWNTDFVAGVGFLPTALVTTGLIGALLWILFIAAYLMAGFRFILARAGDKVARYLVAAPFLTSLFLWLVLVFYAPGPVILALAFGFTGISLAALSIAEPTRIRTIRFADTPTLSFLIVLGLVIAMLGAGAFAWSVGTRFASAVSYAQGIQAANKAGNFDAAVRFISVANRHAPLDLYDRALANLTIAQMNAVAASANEKNADAIRTEFETLLGRAISYGKRAVSSDGAQYENWLTLGRVYEAVVPLKIAGTYEAAKSAYETAQSQNPKNPGIVLMRARLEAAQGNGDAAREFIAQALQAKPNYTEAVFFLSQLEVQEGNIKGAIDSVRAAIFLAPQDPVLHFQLGLLSYNQKDWNSARDAFKQAAALNPQYANAHYFLGLSYYQLKRSADAVAQFEELTKTNPGNKEVALILSNLKAGRAPFADALPPVDSSPERRTSLPVGDE